MLKRMSIIGVGGITIIIIILILYRFWSSNGFDTLQQSKRGSRASIEPKPPMASSVGEISKGMKGNSTSVVHSDKEGIVSQESIVKVRKTKTAQTEAMEESAEEEFEEFWREFEQIMEENKKELEGEIKTALVKAEQILPILREIDAELVAKGGYTGDTMPGYEGTEGYTVWGPGRFEGEEICVSCQILDSGKLRIVAITEYH